MLGIDRKPHFWNYRNVMSTETPKKSITVAQVKDLSHAAGCFAALGHAARLSIVRCLLRSHPVGCIAGEIQTELDIPASTLTHHLDALRHENLITQTRQGRFVRYYAHTETLRQLTEFLYSECCSVGASDAPLHAGPLIVVEG